MRGMVGSFDSGALVFPWSHSDPRMDALCAEVSSLVQRGEKMKLTRTQIFTDIWRAVRAAAEKSGGIVSSVRWNPMATQAATPVPYLDEPWYCCAEPTTDQFVSIGSPGTPDKSLPRPDQYV